jgi:hypothetical protein
MRLQKVKNSWLKQQLNQIAFIFGVKISFFAPNIGI